MWVIMNDDDEFAQTVQGWFWTRYIDDAAIYYNRPTALRKASSAKCARVVRVVLSIAGATWKIQRGNTYLKINPKGRALWVTDSFSGHAFTDETATRELARLLGAAVVDWERTEVRCEP